MSENFQDFRFFAEWCEGQIGYGVENYHIDKDILIPGNKLYSENTCVFVPAALNKFFIASDASRGLYPLGVSTDNTPGRFRVILCIDGVQRRIGSSRSIQEASEMYKIAKEKEAKRWYARLSKSEFIVDPRVIKAVGNWQYSEK
jgi:hypothetical protein